MLNEDAFPGEFAIDSLAESVAALAYRNQRLVADLGPKGAEKEGLKRHLERNPSKPGRGKKAPAGPPTSSTRTASSARRSGRNPTTDPPSGELARELADWRLAEYVDCLERQPQDEAS